MSLACARVQSWIPEAVLGDLDEGTRAQIRAHARQCAECAGAYEFQAALQEEIQASALAPPPGLYFAGVLAEIHQRASLVAPRRPARRRRLSREFTATAMAAALALVWVRTNLAPLLPDRPPTACVRSANIGILSQGSRLAAKASVEVARTLVLVQGIGFVDSKSGILNLPTSTLREIGFMRAGAAAHAP